MQAIPSRKVDDVSQSVSSVSSVEITQVCADPLDSITGGDELGTGGDEMGSGGDELDTGGDELGTGGDELGSEAENVSIARETLDERDNHSSRL
ncbi:unnamed protein product [Phytophthora fragariaefolia]|uniref:Unnamed protein product n=1 Tax=Phytophthora fragariaefolia TaxID=1490495 RepID=A0A9W6Y3B4_9STRA|nr:unnamed protein product [Phytophthora fragariaefolia]GMF54378.1 unnamed protein product [Phytophthora fragariaefolia]